MELTKKAVFLTIPCYAIQNINVLEDSEIPVSVNK